MRVGTLLVDIVDIVPDLKAAHSLGDKEAK